MSWTNGTTRRSNYVKATFPQKPKRNLSIFGSSSTGANPPSETTVPSWTPKPPKKVGFVRLGGLQAKVPFGWSRFASQGVVTENERPCCFFVWAIANQNFQGKSDSSLSTRSNSKKNWPTGLIISLATICWIKPYHPWKRTAKEPRNWCFGGVRCFFLAGAWQVRFQMFVWKRV